MRQKRRSISTWYVESLSLEPNLIYTQLVEEVEERLDENKRAEILELVQRGLHEPLFLPGDDHQASGMDIDVTEQQGDGSEDEGPTGYPQDEGYDEDGEGEGFEGDLEIDEVPD